MKSVCSPLTLVDGSFAPRPERHHLFAAPLHRVDELERADAVIVVGARLDHHLFELGHLAIAGRTHDADVGRPIVEHADEVLRPLRARQPVDVLEADAVGAVLRDGQAGHERGRLLALGPERQRRAAFERDRAATHRLVGVDADRHVGAGRAEDVAAVLLVARRHLRERREGVLEIDARDAGGVDRGHLVLGRRQRPGDDAVAEIGLHLRPVGDVAGALAAHRLRHRVGGGDDQRRHVGGGAVGQAVEPRGDPQRRAAGDAHVPGRDHDRELRRRDVEARRLHGAPRRRPGKRQRDGQHDGGRRGPPQRPAHRVARDDALRFDLAQPRLGGAHQQAVERARRLRRQPLRRGHDDVVELAVLLLGETRQLAIAGRPAQRRLQTDHGGHRGHDGHDEEADEREAGRRRRGVDGPRGAGDEGDRRRLPRRDTQPGQRLPAPPQAVQPPSQRLVSAHATVSSRGPVTSRRLPAMASHTSTPATPIRTNHHSP